MSEAKVLRALRFITGARILQIFNQLTVGGFTAADLNRGAALLSAASSLLYPSRKSLPNEANLIEGCEAFQRRWYRPVRAALTHSFPQIAEEFFKDFTVERGIAAITSVQVFLRRLEALQSGAAPFGEDGPKARELLRTRQLDAQVEADARALVGELASVTELRSVPENGEELDAAVQALWAWYLDWSATARTVVTKKSYLRVLGFGSRASKDELDLDDTKTSGSPQLAGTSSATAPQLSAAATPTSSSGATPLETFPFAAE
jgi:hypothetical protein